MSNWKKVLQAAAGAGGGEPFATVGYTYEFYSQGPSFTQASSEPLSFLLGGDHPDGRDFVQAGDLIVIITHIGDFNTNRAVSYTGYTQALGLYLNASGDGYNSNVYIHYKIADGTETQIDQPYLSGASSQFVAGVFSGAAAAGAIFGSTVNYGTITSQWTNSGTSATFLGPALSGGSYSGDSYIMYASGYSTSSARDSLSYTSTDPRLNGTFSNIPEADQTDPSNISTAFGCTQLETSETDLTFSATTYNPLQQPTITIGTNFALAFRIPKA